MRKDASHQHAYDNYPPLQAGMSKDMRDADIGVSTIANGVSTIGGGEDDSETKPGDDDGKGGATNPYWKRWATKQKGAEKDDSKDEPGDGDGKGGTKMVPHWAQRWAAKQKGAEKDDSKGEPVDSDGKDGK